MNKHLILEYESISFLTCSDRNGWTVLHAAVHGGSLPAVKLVVKHLQSLLNVKNLNGKTPAEIAVSQNQHSVLKYLFEVGVKPVDESIPWTSLLTQAVHDHADDDTVIIVIDEILKSSGRDVLTEVEFSNIYCLCLLSFSLIGELISQ